MRADASDDFEGHDRRPHTTSRPAELLVAALPLKGTAAAAVEISS